MKYGVQFGAGNIGRGFIGNLLWETGYQTIFVEVFSNLVDQLNERKSYPLRLLEKSGQERNLTIDNIEAFCTEEQGKVAEALSIADVVFTAVGVKNLPFIVPLLAEGLRLRFQKGAGFLNIFLCENLKGAPEFLKEKVLAFLNEEEKKYVEEKIGFVGTVVARMVPVMDRRFGVDDPLFVVAESYHKLPYDARAIKGSAPDISGLKPVDNFQAEVDKKLFIHNLGHASIAYLGYLKGYAYIHQSVPDLEIKDILDHTLEETLTAILKKHSELDSREQRAFVDDLKERFTNPAIMDTVQRVGRDPLRKLGPDDRIVGGARLCLSQDIFPETIARVAGAALCCDFSSDGEAMKLQKMIREKGIMVALREVTGIDPDSTWGQRIIESYRVFHARFRKSTA